MRLPFSEFITGGDLKFVILYILFTGMAIFHFIKKRAVQKEAASSATAARHQARICQAASWILILSVTSLLLGFMHSFYFMAKAGGIAPAMIYQGVSNALITPVMGLAFYMICLILKGSSMQQNDMQ